jgi:hypothetical protein
MCEARRAEDSTHGSRLGTSSGCANADPDEPVSAGTHLTAGIRGAEHEMTRSHRDLFTVDHHRAAPTDHCVDLFLTVRGMVVFRPLCTRRKLEPIDLELAHAERRAQAAKHAVGRLDIICVDHRMCHRILPEVVAAVYEVDVDRFRTWRSFTAGSIGFRFMTAATGVGAVTGGLVTAARGRNGLRAAVLAAGASGIRVAVAVGAVSLRRPQTFEAA